MMRYIAKKGFIPKVFWFFSFFVFWLTCYLPCYPTAFAGSYTQDGNPCPPECVSDSLEIETYYPSPYGYYEELRGDKIIVGDSDNSYINETDLPPTGTLTFEPKTSAEISNTGTYYEGSIYYDKNDQKFKYYKNSAWQDLGGGRDYWKPSTASGGSDNIYYSYNNGVGNVGIGVGSGDIIGAKLQVNPEYKKIGLVIRKSSVGSYASQTYSTSGSYSYAVPSGIGTSYIRITAYGASGSGGGNGGFAQGIILVQGGDILYVYVGGQNGFNGGGAGNDGGGGGGGASDVRKNSTAVTARIIVAGGGGGNGRSDGNCGGGSGGAGGGLVGVSGTGGQTGCCTGNNSGSSSGGAGGDVGGNLFQGGDASTGRSGGGGGGYYGGNAGNRTGCSAGGGGGGGSSFIPSGGTTQSGVRSGNGEVIIEPIFSGSDNLMEWQDGGGTTMNIVDMNGNLGLGSSTTNSYKLYVNGSAYVTSGAWTASDLRFKENILPLNNSLDKILNIQPVSFDWNKSGYPQMNFEQDRQIGLVAQEVEKEIPELVRTDTNGYKSIAYDKLTVVTIEAVKEQQKEIEQLKDALRAQEERNQEKLRKQQKEIELLKAEKEFRS